MNKHWVYLRMSKLSRKCLFEMDPQNWINKLTLWWKRLTGLGLAKHVERKTNWTNLTSRNTSKGSILRLLLIHVTFVEQWPGVKMVFKSTYSVIIGTKGCQKISLTRNKETTSFAIPPKICVFYIFQDSEFTAEPHKSKAWKQPGTQEKVDDWQSWLGIFRCNLIEETFGIINYLHELTEGIFIVILKAADVDQQSVPTNEEQNHSFHCWAFVQIRSSYYSNVGVCMGKTWSICVLSMIMYHTNQLYWGISTQFCLAFSRLVAFQHFPTDHLLTTHMRVLQSDNLLDDGGFQG